MAKKQRRSVDTGQSGIKDRGGTAVSDMQQGPGWWQASDGKWYPPESHPTRQAPVPPPVQPPAGGIPHPTSAHSVPPPGYPPLPGAVPAAPPGAPTGAYQQWGPGNSPYGVAPVYANAKRTNGLAIASLATSAGGVIPIFFGIPCVVGIILGFVALSQIKRSQGAQQGRGLAIAGVAVGFSLIAIFILLVSVGVTTSHTNNT
jgi:hypothetical protein